MRGRIFKGAVLASAAAIALTACGGDDTPNTAPSPGATGGGGGDKCEPFKAYGDLKGKTVTIYSGIVTPEDKPHIESYKPFEECTGATVKYTADKTFETQILVRAKAGNPPDLAIVPQPGLLQQLVATGKAVEAPAGVTSNVDKHWTKEWKAYATVGGKFYGAPLGASVKSLVWYSPAEFQEKGVQPPKTLDELYQISDKLAEGNRKPWCAGVASGEATGWPITDWMEDMMLRLSGPEEYDKWVKHEIPFNSEGPTAALEEAGKILKNDKYVNGGLGNVKSIASTTFQDGGLSILEGSCSLHRQASFYAANWPKGTKVAEDGDVFAFYFPPIDPSKGKPVLVAGEFVSAFADRDEVVKVQTYLASAEWANSRAKLGDWVSANKGLDASAVVNPIDKLSVQILQDPATVARFDGSDLMPAQVGAKSFWTGMTDWINGTKDTKATLDFIEGTWPK